MADLSVYNNLGNRFGVTGPHYGPAGHRGQDFRAAAGTPIPVYKRGRVVSSDLYTAVLGYCTVVQFDDGLYAGWAHIRKGTRPAVGTTLEPGDSVGVVAGHGDAHGSAWTGPHIHTTLGTAINSIYSGAVRDPLPYIQNAIRSISQAGGGITPIVSYAYGLSSDAQRAAQEALSGLGYYDGTVDGVFGAESVKALQQHMRDIGILSSDYEVDGIPGRVYAEGVQRLAAKYGGYTGPIDGEIGALTSAGVVGWAKATLADLANKQVASGLTTDAQRRAQEALQKLGLYSGTIDGQFGPASVSALQQYLKNVGLLPGDYVVDGQPGPSYAKAIQALAAKHGYTGPIDGEIGAATSAGIVAWAGSVLTPVTPTNTGGGEAATDYAYGLSTDAQRSVQTALQKLGFYTGPIDGAFGPSSVTAFQQYLKSQNLLPADYTADGMPGPTYAKAIQALAAKHGYTGPADGAIGNLTSSAIVTWGGTIAAPTTPTPVDPPTPPVTPAKYASFGIDVATTQSAIDFARAKAEGVQFVIVKMGGLNVTPQYVSPHYRKQIDGARAQGLPVGHYYVLGKGQTPEQQAEFFVKNLYNFDVKHDVLVLDNEILDSNGTFWRQDDAVRFLARVIELTGIDPKRVWHYAGAADYRNQRPWDKVAALGVRFWWAAYGNAPTGKEPDHEPSLQGSIPDWHVHQYTSRASIAGYALDGNVSRLPVTELFSTGEVTEPEEPDVPVIEPDEPTTPTIPEPPVSTDPTVRNNWIIGVLEAIIAFLKGTTR